MLLPPAKLGVLMLRNRWQVLTLFIIASPVAHSELPSLAKATLVATTHVETIDQVFRTFESTAVHYGLKCYPTSADYAAGLVHNQAGGDSEIDQMSCGTPDVFSLLIANLTAPGVVSISQYPSNDAKLNELASRALRFLSAKLARDPTTKHVCFLTVAPDPASPCK